MNHRSQKESGDKADLEGDGCSPHCNFIDLRSNIVDLESNIVDMS